MIRGVNDDEFLSEVISACRRLPNAEAVALGGSRTRGDHRPDSDWDFAVYYRGDIDVRPFEQLGWAGRVFRPFEWGQVMYGGAVFDLDGRHLDIHYRNLDVVEHWSKEAEQGRFEVYILGFHLAGIPTYMLRGELAINRVIWGELPPPTDYPTALRRAAPRLWLDRADNELEYCRYWAATANPINCVGSLARIVLQCAHARLAHQGVWALNEKRMVEWAQLTNLYDVFASIGSSSLELEAGIEAVAALAVTIRREVGDADQG
jgi:predicted nucleotidyltransferase